MSVLPSSLLDALEAEESLWPGAMDAEARARLELALATLPDDVTAAAMSGLLDPERNDWARGVVCGIAMAGSAGARVVGMATDDLVEMVDARGERFGLSPLGFQIPRHRWGAPDDVERLLAGLDNTFAGRRWILYVRRPVPPGIEVAPITRAVHLWLSAIERGERDERHAVYEDGDVAIDITLDDAEGKTGRILTIGPVTSLERLGAIDARIVDVLVRHEEAVGDLPIVAVLTADQPWGLSRGYVQQLLYGTPRLVSGRNDGKETHYEAQFLPNGRSLFSDPACRMLASIWWMEPRGDALQFGVTAHDNPWVMDAPQLPVTALRFCLVDGLGPDRGAVLTWSRP